MPMAGSLYAVPYFLDKSVGWIEVSCMLVFYILTGLGITLGFHRYFTHQSFSASFPLKVFLAISGSMAFQGPIISWVADHRRHHRYSDKSGDPHSTSHTPICWVDRPINWLDSCPCRLAVYRTGILVFNIRQRPVARYHHSCCGTQLFLVVRIVTRAAMALWGCLGGT